MSKPAFQRYIGIDYSGAKTPSSSLPGIRVYQATGEESPTEVQPPPSPKKYWTRQGLAYWLETELSKSSPAIAGIDHGFSFPLRYFETHHLKPDWPSFLEDFHRHWPSDEAQTSVEMIRKGLVGNGAARGGNTRWRRITEQRTRAKSVFHFDVQGQVAKSTHSGLPWLRYLRHQLGQKVHFWPFDGWEIPPKRSTIVEVYPGLWSGQFPSGDRTSDQHDAFTACAWLKQADREDRLASFLKPSLSPWELSVAEVEGWILGVM